MANKTSENSKEETIEEILSAQFRKNADPTVTILSSNHEISCKVKFKKDAFHKFLENRKRRKKADTSRWMVFIGNGLCRAFTSTTNGQQTSFNEKFDLNNENNQDKQNKINFWKGGEQLNLENLIIASSESELLKADSHTIFFVNSLSEFSWFQN